MHKKKKIIGRIEHLDFPELGLFDMQAKIDTGAFRSSLHCHSIKKNKAKDCLELEFLRFAEGIEEITTLLIKDYSRTKVKSSSGQTEERFVIKTPVKIGKKKFKAEFTLTDRSYMKYPVLLGRKLLRNRYIVDVSSKYNFD